MEIRIDPGGTVHAIYDESFELTSLGPLSIRRASHVEPTTDGRWTADLSPVNGPVLGPFDHRSEALNAELTWLHEHWLGD